jgi:ABC-type dipeptide/oligopeptide/nickel transport system permease subunit
MGGMARTATLAEAPPAGAERPSVRLGAVRGSPLSLSGAGLVLVFVLCAALAPALAPHDPEDPIAQRLTAPQRAYPMGTDEFGRDILSRIIFGARISLWVGVVAVGIGLAAGAGASRVLLLHVLPNVAAPLIVQTTLALSTAILAEATLSFLGLGVQPPEPSWGTMLGTGRKYMELAPWAAIFPGAAVMLLVLGFNLLGDGLRDVLDPRLRP